MQKASLSGVFGILLVLSFVGNLINPLPMEAKVMPLIVSLLSAIVLFTHCVMSFIVLLNSDNVRDFE